MNKIDPTKKYTSNGEPVEFLHRAPDGWPGKYSLRGMVSGLIMYWTDDGRYNIGISSPEDLIEVREPMEITKIVGLDGKIWDSICTPEEWDKTFARNSPHRLVKFREVIP